MGFRGLGREDAQRLLRWGPMAVADFASEWFSHRRHARDRLRPRHPRRLRRPLVGGHHREPAAAGRVRRRQRGGQRRAARRAAWARWRERSAAAARAARRGDPHGRGRRAHRGPGRPRAPASSSPAARRSRRAPSSPAPIPSARSSDLLDPAVLDPDDVRQLRNYRQQGMASKVNLALDSLPPFRGDVDPRSCAAASTSAPTSTTSSAPSTTRNTAAFPASRTSRPRSRRCGIRRWPRRTARDVGLRAVHPVRAARRQLGPRREEVGDAALRDARDLRPRDLPPRAGAAGADSARPRADVRPDRRASRPRRDGARPALPRASAAGLGPLSRSAARAVHVRRGHAPGGRSHGRAGPRTRPARSWPT